MIKLIVTDMDGTLLDRNHNINPEFWEIYKKIKEKGIYFCVASGRQYFNLIEHFERIKNDIFFIAENGGYIAKGHEEIFSKELPSFYPKKFIDIARKLKRASVVLCGKNTAFIENKSPEFIEEVSKYYKKLIIVDDLKKVEDDILKVAVYDFECAQTNSYPHYKEFEKDLKVIVSTEHWLDIMHNEVNKGMAVREIKKRLNITKEETLIFGDYMNDYEMMAEAKYSYAMENGHPDLIEAANYIAPSNNDNGVVKIIKEYLKD